MDTKICFTCKKEFTPSSRHKNFPKCREHGYNMCSCGRRKTREAKMCSTCYIPLDAELSGNWKGGRSKHSKGYIMLYAPDHPRCGRNKYVFEHILVMEENLGRYLLPTENVHHKNGQKDDNSIENLELWCKPQPTGVRAEDAYKYALQLIELYEPLFGSNKLET